MGIVPKLKEEYLISNPDIYVTQSAYDVKNRLLSAKEELRILYDYEENIYLICNAYDSTHLNAVRAAMEDGYFSEYKNAQDYADNGSWETWKFIPSKLIDNSYENQQLGIDDYWYRLCYCFGDLLARFDDFFDYELINILGEPEDIYEFKDGEEVLMEESLREAKNKVRVGDEIDFNRAKNFYNRGYIDLVIENDKGESKFIPAWHSKESQKELSRGIVKDKKTGKDVLKITGDKIDLPKFDEVVNDAKKELGNDIKFYTQSPETNKTYYNEIEDEKLDRVVGTAYKLFKVVNGKLYPPMVKNPGNSDTPVGVWIKCGVEEFDEISSGWGKPQAKGKDLAFRAGWHLGELPYAPQFESKINPGYLSDSKFVWAECLYDATVDYQQRAMSYGYTKDGKFTNSAAGLPYRPEGGYYKYRTNPDPDTIAWVITGSMKVERILSDEEVKEICEKNEVPYLKRPGGDKTLKELGLQESLTESILSNNIYITENPRRVRDLLYRTKDPVRILYDINSHIYMMGDANEYIHRDLINKAIDDGWYGNELKRWEVDNYVYDTYDEDDNLVQNVVYIVFTPKGNNDTVGGEIGSDGYFDSYDYDIGSILTRDDYDSYWEKTELSKLLGERKQHRFKSGWDENNMPIIQTEEMKLTEDIPAVMKNYPKIPENIFYQLIKLDPTYKEGSNSVGTYGKWLLNLFNKKALKKEDFYKVPEYLKEFEKKKKWMKNKDIGQFKTLGDLAQALENTQEGELSQNQKDKQFKKEIKNADLNADKVYEDSKWEVWIPKDYESSCKIATNTRWCTGPSSGGDDTWYDRYTSSGNLYIIINKQDNDEKYQFHFPSKQYMDRNDRSIDKDKFLSENEGLKNFFDGEEKRAQALLKEKAEEKIKELRTRFEAGTLSNANYLNKLVETLGEIFGEYQEEGIFDEAFRDDFEIALPPKDKYFITISKEDIADKYCRYPNDGRDMGEDFFKACFEGNLWDYWYEGDADAAIDSSLLDEYSESTLKKLGFPENIYELIEKDKVPEEFEDDVYELEDCFRFASQRASTDGAISEVLDDFQKSMENALDDVFKDTVWTIDSDGVAIDSINFSNLIEYREELADNMHNYSDTFTYFFPYTMAEVIAANLHFNEPYYGWYGFDEDVFNDELQNLLYDSFGDREKTTESLKESLTPKGDIKDKRILDLIHGCIDKLREIGYNIEDDIDFKYGSGTHTLGTMSYPVYAHKNYTLTLNDKLFDLSEETIKNTIYHELCHYIVEKKLFAKDIIYYDNLSGRLMRRKKYYKQGTHGPHGTWWQSVAQKVGSATNQDITRLANSDEIMNNVVAKREYKYSVTCKNCGNELKYMKATDFVKNPNAKSKNGDWYRWACGRCHRSGQFEVKKL